MDAKKIRLSIRCATEEKKGESSKYLGASINISTTK